MRLFDIPIRVGVLWLTWRFGLHLPRQTIYGRATDSSIEEPHSLEWEDGTPATLRDYRNHAVDTYCSIANPRQEIERHIFPGHVALESSVGDWVLRGPEAVTAALDVKNPNSRIEFCGTV